MSYIQDCPLPPMLPSLPTAGCAFNIDQVLRLAYQRKQLTPPFGAANPITLKASWDTFVAADDDTKIVFSPIFANFAIPPSESKFEGGGDNSTPFGNEEYVGEQGPKATYTYKKVHPSVINVLRKFIQESIPTVGLYALTVFLMTKNRQIAAVQLTKKVGQTTTLNEEGIGILNNTISSRGTEGFKADLNNASFSLSDDWDANVVLFTPTDFDPLTDF